MKKCSLGLLCMSALVLVGCGPVHLSEPNEYMLSAQKQVVPSKVSRTRKTLLVATPVAAPGFQSRNMIYVQTPFKLQAYTQSQWVAPPARMLTSVLVNALRSTNYFKAVAAPPFVGKTDYQLNTQLVALGQSFRLPTSQIHLVLSVSLVKVSTLQVLATKTFVRDVKAPGNNAYSGVVAANQAAAWASKQIARFAVRSVTPNASRLVREVSLSNVPKEIPRIKRGT
jgi:cholesterol transport system auxiliary component